MRGSANSTSQNPLSSEPRLESSSALHLIPVNWYDLLPEVEDLYKRNAVGCCLHIALDDGNLKDADIQFCMSQAKDNHHLDCEALAWKLLAFSETQRRKLYKAR